MRVIYNTTYLVDATIGEDWVNYIKTKHAPAIMSTHRFDEWKLCRIYGDQNEQEISYALQFVAKSFQDFKYYRDNYATLYQNNMEKIYTKKCVFFKTLMEVLEESL